MSRTITRRQALTSVAAVSAAVAIPATTMAAGAASAEFGPHDPRHPWNRAHDLAKELSEVLSLGNGSGTGPGSRWSATIYPNAHPHGVIFGNISAQDRARDSVSLPWLAVKKAHEEARAAFGKTCDETDDIILGREPSKAALRRWKRAEKVEDRALVAVCAFRPHGEADARAKFEYLMPLVRHAELQPYHVEAIVQSGVRS